VAFACLLALLAAVQAGPNGFHLSGGLVSEGEILPGGPPRDGIPAIDAPRFVAAATARHLAPDDRVLGVVVAGVAKAYPIKILSWHEIVNDRAADGGLLVTYCPLCGSGVAFRVAAGARFGVSGLLYRSDLLLYDRSSESLWSQIRGIAITGPRKGEHLTPVPVRHTTWGRWRHRHPATVVLSQKTGYHRSYGRSPYGGYEASPRLYFPVPYRSSRYPPKAWVLGVTAGGQYRAYPFVELAKAATPVVEQVAGHTVTVHYDPTAPTAWAEVDGREVAATRLFWFAWYAFHPETTLFPVSPPAGRAVTPSRAVGAKGEP